MPQVTTSLGVRTGSPHLLAMTSSAAMIKHLI